MINGRGSEAQEGHAGSLWVVFALRRAALIDFTCMALNKPLLRR